jgi:cyclophilin family peptidyl-prolyl cis-trans isomerase
MANAGPDTNKSQVRLSFSSGRTLPTLHWLLDLTHLYGVLRNQFFITYGRQPSLDGKYTIFGK